MIIKAGGPGSESRRLAAESAAAFERAGEATNATVAAIEFAEGVEKAGDAELAAAYTYLQRAVGVIAISLPWVLFVGHFIFSDDGFPGSISAYYYTHMGPVFVGSLCALAVFFLSYNYRPIGSFETDNVLSTAACIAFVGVAVFPTAAHAGGTTSERVVSVLHLVCAGVLFSLLGVFAHFRFTKTKPGGVMSPEKARRNRLYRICGKVIFASMALVLLSNAVQPPSSWKTLFWLETICVEAFGLSWLVKGGFRGWLADKFPAPTP
jgi:hypothetical protein